MTEPATPADKWDRIYASRPAGGEPAEVLADNLHLLPRVGTALDLACGLGGNAVALARAGLTVDATDVSGVAIGKVNTLARANQLAITGRVVDVTQQRPPARSYDAIVVCRYLARDLCPDIANALRPGGLLFYQTFTANRVTPGGPSNTDFLLKPNELLRLFNSLQVRVFRDEDVAGETTAGLRNQSYLIAQRPPDL